MSNRLQMQGALSNPNGRPKGRKDLRYTPIAQDFRAAPKRKLKDFQPLLRLAQFAEDDTLDAELRISAINVLLPYLLPKMKPVEHDPAAALDYEKRLAEIKAGTIADEAYGLADRLSRAAERMDADLRARIAALRSGRSVPLPKPRPELQVGDRFDRLENLVDPETDMAEREPARKAEGMRSAAVATIQRRVAEILSPIHGEESDDD